MSTACLRKKIDAQYVRTKKAHENQKNTLRRST